MSQLFTIKKGEIKTGFLSKRIAAEIKFYDDKIVAAPRGWNKFFNNSDTVIEKKDIRRIRITSRIIGYNVAIETLNKDFSLSLMGDKLEITRIVELFQRDI